MSNNIYFSPKTQFENVGDALINVVLCNMLSEHGTFYLNLSRCPDEFKLNFRGVLNSSATVPINSFPKYICHIVAQLIQRKDCYLFLSPGGYFGELTIFQYAKSRMYNALLKLYSGIGLKVCLIGVSYERIGYRHLKILKSRSKMLHQHHVRDSLSYSYAEKLGIKVDKCSTDLAFGMQSINQAVEEKKYRIAVSIRTDQYSGQFDDNFEIIAQILLALELKPNSKISIVSQVRRDDLAIGELEKKILEIVPSIHIEKIMLDSIEEAQKVYWQCEMVLTNRLHVMLLAASARSKTIALAHEEYNKKLIGIVSDLGMENQPLIVGSKIGDIGCRNMLARLNHLELRDLPLRKHICEIFNN